MLLGVYFTGVTASKIVFDNLTSKCKCSVCLNVLQIYEI